MPLKSAVPSANVMHAAANRATRKLAAAAQNSLQNKCDENTTSAPSAAYVGYIVGEVRKNKNKNAISHNVNVAKCNLKIKIPFFIA